MLGLEGLQEQGHQRGYAEVAGLNRSQNIGSGGSHLLHTAIDAKPSNQEEEVFIREPDGGKRQITVVGRHLEDGSEATLSGESPTAQAGCRTL